MGLADALFEYFFRKEEKRQDEIRDSDRATAQIMAAYRANQAAELDAAIRAYEAMDPLPETALPPSPPPAADDFWDPANIDPDAPPSGDSGAPVVANDGDVDFTLPKATDDAFAITVGEPDAPPGQSTELRLDGQATREPAVEPHENVNLNYGTIEPTYTPTPSTPPPAPTSSAPPPAVTTENVSMSDSSLTIAPIATPDGPNANRRLVLIGAIAALVVIIIIVAIVVGGGSGTSKSRLPTTRISVPRLPITQATTPPGFTNILIATNEGSLTGNPCQVGGLRFTWKIAGIAPRTVVVVKFTGRGLPPHLSFLANPNEPFMSPTFPITGAGQWTDTIVSIGTQPPPSSGAYTLVPVQC
ncbi:MAG TPA: hypothetical protein VFR41_04505 [Acidimicrobiia bacterium]|nr:hypothetical protein [Acidimicrobiia bacterium]